MKTILLALNVLFCAASLLAQGTLQFGNNFPPNFRAPIYGCDPFVPLHFQSGQSELGLPAGTTVYRGPLLQGTGYTMALFAGPSGATEGSLVFVASTTFRTATGNVLPAGLVNTVQVVVPGVPAGQAATLQVRVWDNEGGTILSWAQLLASQYQSAGKSSLFVSQPLGGLYDPNLPPSLPPQMTGWMSFEIGGEGCVPVPEPSVLTLAILGLGARLWRKRKST